MATLLITKKTGDYFSFVLNGDYSNEILNTRNDLTVVKGNESHFKTANGANLIKEQIIYPADVTIVDGVTTLNPTTVTQLFTMLISVGYFDWIDASGGGGGVTRFDQLLDTFTYFGKNGQTIVVDEAQMRLKPVTFYNYNKFTQLQDAPNALVADKFFQVDPTGTEIVLVDLPPAPSDSTKTDKGGYAGTSQDLADSISNIGADIDAELLLKEDTGNKQDSLTVDGTGSKFPTVDAVNSGLSGKLNISDYNDYFKGKFTSLSALEIAFPTAQDGDYAIVDAGSGSDAKEYIWDSEEGWVEGGGSGASTTDALPEGSLNLYFTTTRVLSTLLSGLTLINGAIVSADSVLVAFGKIQKQINDLIPFATTKELMFACSDEVSDLTTGILLTFRMPYGLTLTEIKLCVNSAPSVTKVIVDVKKNGTTIFSTLPSIDPGSTTSVGAVPYVISNNNLSDDSIITIITTSVGSGILAKGLKVTLIGTKQ